MYVTSFCKVLKKTHTNETWSFFSASRCGGTSFSKHPRRTPFLTPAAWIGL